ncbi:MAG: hypothetical protein WAW41_14275 [Methylobacter sp.]
MKIQKKHLNTAFSPVVKLNDAMEVRTLCIFLVVQSVVSFRSVPRIIELFRERTTCGLQWRPHFTSVINWTLRLGLGLLKQVKPISVPWLAIVDHSIDIGTKKALVVLRVTVDALSKRGSAIQLKDCECIGLKVCEKVNGESVEQDLKEIYTQSGNPKATIKDGDYTLGKGVRLWSERQEPVIPAIQDISHVMANALKDQYEDTSIFKSFTAMCSQGAKCLRQTDLAFLTPPKLRSKGRFLSISKLGKWAENMLEVLSVKGRSRNGSLLEKIRKALPGFILLKPFIKRFAQTTKLVSEIMEVLKNKGLDQSSYEKCRQLSKGFPRNSKVKKTVEKWLDHHIEIQKQITELPLLVNSDIIESLFGNFKHIIARSPQADMNRTTLLIPALCGTLDENMIMQALSQARHDDLRIWEEENIPYTIRKRRQAFFT